ncbi:MAG: hypothetical protein ACI8RD_009415 [Bacillariaceae sp.]|jgi:hypothetical protein
MRLPLIITAAVAASVFQASEASTTDHRYKKDEHIELWVNKVSIFERSCGHCVYDVRQFKDLAVFFFSVAVFYNNVLCMLFDVQHLVIVLLNINIAINLSRLCV